MKKLFFIAVFVIATISVFAQERVNREKNTFTKESGMLTKATGWAYNESLGEWIDYDNVICSINDYKTQFKALLGSDYMKSRYMNFNSIQTKTMVCDGTEYYCLIVKKWSGRYKYPSIKEDWYTFEVVDFLFLSKKEYEKLFTLTNNVTEVQGWTQTKYEYETLTEAEFADSKIRNQRENPNNFSYKQKTLIQVYKATDGNIRFLFGEPSKYSDGIDKRYFETNESEWNKLKFE